MAEPRRISFLGLPLSTPSTAEFIDWTAAEAKARRKRLIGYLNAANVNLAFKSAEAARLFRHFDCLYADGQAVVWGARWLELEIPERVNAGDFIGKFFARCARENLRVALVGGYPGDAAGFGEHFKREVPGLNIVLIEHGFFGKEGSPSLHAWIEKADPDIVLVGMGSPRQEELAAQWAESGPPRVWWCVGALFEYFSGRRLRAPVWMRRAGLEWLFRLVLEPRRLWRRYVIGNPKFLYRVLRGFSVPDSSATGSASWSSGASNASSASASELDPSGE